MNIEMTDMEAEANINAIDVYRVWLETTRDTLAPEPLARTARVVAVTRDGSLMAMGEVHADAQAVRAKLVEGLGYDPNEGIDDPTKVIPSQ